MTCASAPVASTEEPFGMSITTESSDLLANRKSLTVTPFVQSAPSNPKDKAAASRANKVPIRRHLAILGVSDTRGRCNFHC